jgi:hypothetical protein
MAHGKATLGGEEGVEEAGGRSVDVLLFYVVSSTVHVRTTAVHVPVP